MNKLIILEFFRRLSEQIPILKDYKHKIYFDKIRKNATNLEIWVLYDNAKTYIRIESIKTPFNNISFILKHKYISVAIKKTNACINEHSIKHLRFIGVFESQIKMTELENKIIEGMNKNGN